MTTTLPDYETSDFNGHVDVGGYKLHVQLAGRPREDNDPLIICIHGTAGHLEQFAAVIRTVQHSHRVLAYTRSGLGHSDPKSTTSTTPPTLNSIAAELHALLTSLSLPPPYLLLGHSWGGMLSLHMTSTFSPNPFPGVQGLVILDGGMPTLSSDFQSLYSSFSTDPGTPWAHPCVFSLLKDLDVHRIQEPPHLFELTEEEHAALRTARSTDTHKAGTPIEFAGLLASYNDFIANAYDGPSALPSIPICLIHAHAHESFRQMFEAGVARRNGTEEEKKDFEKLLETWGENVLANQRQFLRYAGKKDNGDEGLGRSIMAKEGTSHSVMLMDVKSVVEGVAWVVAQRKS